MGRKNISSLGAILLCSLLAVVALTPSLLLTNSQVGTAAATRAQPKASVSGVITDAFGAPLADAIVSLYSLDRVLQTKSDGKGQFLFAHVPPCTYQMKTVHQGFKTKRVSGVQVADKNEPLTVSLAVADSGDCSSFNSVSYNETAGRTLFGTVLDSRHPVVGAEVELIGAFNNRVLAAIRSNEKGEFRFTDLEPGQYHLRVSHAGYQVERTEEIWIARENGTEIEVEIIKQGLIRVCQ